MLLKVDFKSGEPVYLQLISQVRSAAASGALRAGETLPSSGAAAEQLRISRNHVAKAYRELESIGIIEMVSGKGYCLKEQHRPSSKGVLRVQASGLAKRERQRTFRQALAHSLPAVIATTLYLMLAGAGTALFLWIGLMRGELPVIVTTLFIAGVLLPVRDRLEHTIERALFPKRRMAPQVLRSLKEEFLLNPSLDALLQRIADISQDFIGVRPGVIRDHREMSALADLFPALRTVSGPVPTANDWLVPLFSPDELIAVLKLKSKSQKTTFDSDDWEFLIGISEHFTTIASQMRARNEKAESEYALEIQRGLLPRSIPQVPGFTIAGAWQPAKDVGGDYYDAFPLNENEIALVVADVSGKGAPAALLMANLQATAKAYATSTSSPGELCRRVNSAICGNITPGRFITFFYAVLNTKLSLLTYCNAGHNPPLVVSQDGSCRKLAVGGTVLGLFAQAEFQEGSLQLRAGDRLVIFTDGVIEAADSHEREFGDDRLFTAITASANVSADELRDSIMQAVTHFCRGDFSDDATLLVLLVNAPGIKSEVDPTAAI